ncbi:MAG: FKBP-type peptidyl-prolyl cis-trans isomerase [Chitinophagales bacterium]|nr:FKBP-type peptidyl-prolyl cis-trans isomerase [Saprospirales bacterium]MBP6660276.1 FKBP-type peptidyl-prolyl cis-trans isomerase [Chitinophagales bacterium]HUM52068.1 FKBP-type peptidyl-prolyl cis-trans isomerase [Chitinophagales bacterium]
MKKYLFLLLLPIAIFSCKKNTTDYTEIDRAIIRQYIIDSSLVADSTASGLFYVIADSGTGRVPNINSFVTVGYRGYLTDGKVFDQTAGAPVEFKLSSLVVGWQEGLPLIKNNGKIKLLIPSALGYKDQEITSIPKNSVLIFDISLVGVR